MRSRPRPARAVVFVVATAILASLGTTSAAHADPVYPSWDEVQAAQGDAAAKAAQIASIQGYLDDLEQRATALSVDSLEKGEAYNQARDALDAEIVRAAALENQADAAAESARQSAARAGEVVAQLARAGGGDITMQLLVNSAEADDLLSQLGTMNRLARKSAEVIERAETDENIARSLGEQAARAQKRRETLAGDAEAVLAQAQAASAVAEAKIATQSEASAQLVAQLVLLTGNAEAVSQAYLNGKAWEAAQNAQPPATAPGSPGSPANPAAPVSPANPTPSSPAPANPAPVNPAPANPTPSNPTPVTPSAPTVPVVTAPVTAPPVVKPPTTTPSAPNAGVVAGAIAYARAQLGDAYEWGGSGPDRWDCSGLTKASYASVGVNIGTHSVTNQYNSMSSAGRLVPIAQRAAGDLLFYATGGRAAGGFYHVAIYIGGGQMIEAPRAGVPVRITGYRTSDLVAYAGRPTA
jgi:cell wall-associated NlpC family hydrolase